MIRFLIRTAIFFAAAFIAIIVADIVLSGFSVAGVWSYVVVALIYGVIQGLMEPFFRQVTRASAPMFTGGVGIITAFVALGITNLISGALTIDGLTTWIAAAVIVWLAGALAAFILPLIFVKNRVQERRSDR
jgi:uncharacterized membrane protein YvlD (DUF360 family)